VNSVALQTGEPRKPTARADLNQSIRRFVQTLSADQGTRYIAAFRDLDGDGHDEAIVYLISAGLCGTGGCTTLILSPSRDTWRVVTKIRIARPPIRVLRATSHGWRNLAVWVQGGGIQPGYYAELQFDGKTYPSNPSMPPALRIPEKVGIPAGIVIEGDEEPIPVYGIRP
jgi:hypothetical protein